MEHLAVKAQPDRAILRVRARGTARGDGRWGRLPPPVLARGHVWWCRRWGADLRREVSPLARGLVAERPPPRRQRPGQGWAGVPWIVVRLRSELTAEGLVAGGIRPNPPPRRRRHGT